jgi:choice-of-anchor B domain-containing protein
MARRRIADTPLFRPLFVAAAFAAATTMHTAPGAHAAFGDITLVGQKTFQTTTRITNVWGYYDPVTAREYALVGDDTGGFFIVDVTDPSNPIQVSKVTTVPGRDIRPFGHYVYTCNGTGSGFTSRIVNIANPASPVVLPHVFRSCHTITISPEGNLYAQYVGVQVYDLVNNPEEPDSIYKITNFGHDSTWRRQRLYDFNWNSLNIWNMSNPYQPVLIGSNDDPTIMSYHSGDESEDGNYLYVCDELGVHPTPDIVIFNISNPAAPARVGSISDATSRVHQLYVSGNLMFVAYYTAGFKVYDITNPAAPVFKDSFDTSVFQTEAEPAAYAGAWNAYPFSPSGIVYVSDHPNGLYLFSVEGHTGTVTPVGRGPAAPGPELEQNHPNPFNPNTTIPFTLAARGRARLSVYDVRGVRVRTLVDRELAAGAHQSEWNGTDDRGRPVASGVYYCELHAGGKTATRRMVLVK